MQNTLYTTCPGRYHVKYNLAGPQATTWIRERTKIRDILETIYHRKWSWAGHLTRCNDNRWTTRLTNWIPKDCKRNRGRQQKRWRDDLDTFEPEWRRQAFKRQSWKEKGKAYTQRWAYDESRLMMMKFSYAVYKHGIVSRKFTKFDWATWRKMAFPSAKMLLSIQCSRLLTIVTLLTLGIHLNYSSAELVAFDVKPGGVVHTFEKTEGGITCRFTYAAQGGTKEAWMMNLRPAETESSWECTVERPGGTSYLYFQRFKLKIVGAQLMSVNLEGGPDQKLQPDEYEVNFESSYVGQIDGKFKSMLSKIDALATVHKDEL